MDILLSRSNDGDRTNDHGTRLIGHCPDVAPQAYYHIVYAGAGSELIKQCEARLGVSLPDQFGTFLSYSNGLILFDGKLRVFGYVPAKLTEKFDIHNFPPNLIPTNTYKPLVKRANNCLIIGFYNEDGSYVYLDETGAVIRMAYPTAAREIRRWASFDDWIMSEAVRLNTNGS